MTPRPLLFARARRRAEQPLPWWPLLALALATFTTVTAEMIPAGLLPAMTRGLDVAPSRVGLLVSVWALTVAATSLLLVRATSRIDQRSLAVGCIVLLAAANVLTATAPTYAVVLVSRVAAAAVHGLFWSIVMAYASRIVPEAQVGRAAAVVLAGPTVAGVVGIPLGATLGNAVDWRLPFWGLAGALLLTGALLRTVLPAVKSLPPQPETAGRDEPGGFRQVLLLALGGATLLVGHFLLYTYIAPVLTGLGGFATSSIGPVLLLFGAGGIGGVALAGPLADRWPERSLHAFVVVLAAAASAVSLVAVHRVVALAAILVWGLAIAVLPVLVQSAMLRAATERQRATAGAVLVTAMNGGVAVGAAVGGAVLGAAGPVMLILTAGLVVLVALVPLRAAAARRLEPRRPEPVPSGCVP